MVHRPDFSPPPRVGPRRLAVMAATFLAAAASLGAACANDAPTAAPTAAPDCAAPDVSADLEPFLTSYFASWSRGDMDGYRDHFHPDAVVYLVKSGRVLSAMPLAPFIDGQRAAQESGRPGVERLTSFRADEDRQAATVTAEWELMHDGETTVGVDRFTLIRDEQWRWKIVSLTFYSTGSGRAREGDGAAAGDPRERRR